MQRSILVGWVLLISAEHFVRLVVALLTTLSMLGMTLAARPYRRLENNMLATVTAFLLVLTYFCGILIKVFCSVLDSTTFHLLPSVHSEITNPPHRAHSSSRASTPPWLVRPMGGLTHIGAIE